MIQRDNAPLRSGSGWRDKIQAFNTIDASKIKAVATSMRHAGVWNCVTLVALERLVPGKQAQVWLDRAEMRFISPKQRTLWKRLRFRDNQPMNLQLVKQASRIRLKMTYALHQAGAKILLGTDAMAPFVVPGFSIHDELRNLVAAGLTPYGAIRAGTRDAAEFLQGLDRFGRIAIGKRADMLLLQANPLDNVDNVAKRTGVMVRGRWLPQAELHRMLGKLAARYRRQEQTRP